MQRVGIGPVGQWTSPADSLYEAVHASQNIYLLSFKIHTLLIINSKFKFVNIFLELFDYLVLPYIVCCL